MGQVLHGSARTTEAVRRAIQHSQESLRALAKRDGINQKTIAKWKGRTSVADLSTGPKEPRSTVLSVEEEAVVIAFRKHTMLALVAFPATYGDSGVMTFIVNQQGIVFEKNLGPNTTKTARRMTEYDPDMTWKITPP